MFILGQDVKVGAEEGGFKLENELGLAKESEKMFWLKELEKKLRVESWYVTIPTLP